MMQKHYENFLTTLYKFVTDLDRYQQTPGTKQVLEIYNKLDMAKVIFRVYTLLHQNNKSIASRDESLFQQTFEILPNVNVSEIWPNLVSGRKQKVWTYLSILHIESDILVNSKGEEKKPVEPVKIETQTDKKEPLVFDPYVGIGGNDQSGQEYCVEDMYSSLANMPEDDGNSGPGLESLANMIGLNKMIDFDGLSEQLRNMKAEDIDNATNNIKEMLGEGIDEGTSDMISSMLGDISTEMKTKDLGKGNGFKNIMSIAETVAGKMKPKIQNGELDLNKLVNSTQMFANNCKDKDGNPMFDADSGPFAMLTKLMANMTGPNGGDNQQMMDQCNSMLQGMGMGDMNSMVNKAQQQHAKSGGTKKKKKGGKKKKIHPKN